MFRLFEGIFATLIFLSVCGHVVSMAGCVSIMSCERTLRRCVQGLAEKSPLGSQKWPLSSASSYQKHFLKKNGRKI